MKRSFQKTAKLRPFRCDLDSFEYLVSELLKSFEGGRPTVHVYVKLKSQELDFGNVDEIRSNKAELPAILNDISLSIYDFSSDQDRSCRISSDWGSVKVKAESDSLAWAAGIIEIVKVFSSRNRKWFSLIRSWHLWLMAMMFQLHGALFSVVGVNELPLYVKAPMYLTALTLWYIYFRYEKVLPPVTVVVQESETWIKRHSAELIVGATIIGAIAAITSAAVSIFRQ